MIIFKTTDYLHAAKDEEIFMKYFVTIARKCGLNILEYDLTHITMTGNKQNFLKYYILSAKESIKHGQKLSREIKRILSVLFWK